MATVDISIRSRRPTNVIFSWVNDLLEKIKELLTLPNPPELIPVPVRTPPRRPHPRDR